jgi:hypothetical protein
LRWKGSWTVIGQQAGAMVKATDWRGTKQKRGIRSNEGGYQAEVRIKAVEL